MFSASRHLGNSQVAPSAVTVLTAEDVRRYRWRTLSEALASVRGFYTAYDRNDTYLGREFFGRMITTRGSFCC